MCESSLHMCITSSRWASLWGECPTTIMCGRTKVTGNKPLKSHIGTSIIAHKSKKGGTRNRMKSIEYDKSRLKQALEIISEWNSLGGGFCEAHDVQCHVDFYRQSAQDVLDIVKTLEK